jgi:hypothetical protein
VPTRSLDPQTVPVYNSQSASPTNLEDTPSPLRSPRDHGRAHFRTCNGFSLPLRLDPAALAGLALLLPHASPALFRRGPPIGAAEARIPVSRRAGASGMICPLPRDGVATTSATSLARKCRTAVGAASRTSYKLSHPGCGRFCPDAPRRCVGSPPPRPLPPASTGHTRGVVMRADTPPWPGPEPGCCADSLHPQGCRGRSGRSG